MKKEMSVRFVRYAIEGYSNRFRPGHTFLAILATLDLQSSHVSHMQPVIRPFVNGESLTEQTSGPNEDMQSETLTYFMRIHCPFNVYAPSPPAMSTVK